MIRQELPNKEGMLAFIERMNNSNYYELNALCDIAKKQALRLQELEIHQTTSSYVAVCLSLIDEVLLYIKDKKEHFVPYARSLFEKAADGHDCSNCNGGSCSMPHEMNMAELKRSHAYLKDILNRLQMLALPLYSETIYPDMYRILRNNMALIENGAGELFHLEETYLIPRITEAQKKININVSN